MRIVAIALLCLLFGSCGGGGGSSTGDLISSAPQVVGRRSGVYVEGEGSEKRADLIIDQPDGPDSRRCRAALSLIDPSTELASRPGASLGAGAVAFAGWVTIQGSRVRFESEGVACQWNLVGGNLFDGAQSGLGERFVRCGFPWLGSSASATIVETYREPGLEIRIVTMIQRNR